MVRSHFILGLLICVDGFEESTASASFSTFDIVRTAIFVHALDPHPDLAEVWTAEGTTSSINAMHLHLTSLEVM